MDVIARLPDCDGQAANATSAHKQKIEDPQKNAENSIVRMSREDVRFHPILNFGHFWALPGHLTTMSRTMEVGAQKESQGTKEIKET